MGPRDWAVDVAVALAAFAFGAVQLMVSASLILPDEALRRMLGIEAVVPATSSFIALALTTFPLVARRKSPWLVFVFTLVAFVGLQNSFHGSMLAVFGPMVALFTIVVECSRIEMGVACAASALGLAAATYGGTSAALWFWVYVQNLVLMVVSALGGLAVCAHRDSVRATEQRAEEAERTREEVAARRVEEERVRIAREVHDITAHSLSAVSIQTAAAERLIDRDPAAAREAVSLAHETAKEALEEIRAMIGVLKTGDSSAETTPTEGTARLMDLADYLQEAGVTTTLDVSGYNREATPAFIDIALFGIAREATTNIVRHAHAKKCVDRPCERRREGAAHCARRWRWLAGRCGRGVPDGRTRHRRHEGTREAARRHPRRGPSSRRRLSRSRVHPRWRRVLRFWRCARGKGVP